MAVVANTRLFNVRNSADYYNPIKNVSNTNYYMFAARHMPWPGSSPQPITDSVIETEYTIFEELIFGKIITTNDVAQMVNRYDWVSGTVYDIYDDQDAFLFDKAFFVVSPEGGNYHIFKCLDNAWQSPSTSQPLFSQTSATDESYTTADSYKWKYMYTISSATFNKFSTTNYVPVIANTSVTAAAANGAINNILLLTGGNNYLSFSNGSFSQISVYGNTQKYAIGPTSSNNGFFNGSAIYINSGPGAGQVKEIVDYTVTSNQYIVTTATAFSPQPDLTSTYQITPNVKILGDGTGATASVVVNTSTYSIARINVVNGGIGYTYANVNIVGNTGTLVANSATARAIISPMGGHGSDVVSELNGNKVGFSITFANSEANTISTDNDYSRIGILKNPLLANVALTFANSTGAFLTGETITQTVNSTYGSTGSVVSTNSTVVLLTGVQGQFTTGSIVGSNTGFTANVTAVTGPSTTFVQTTRLTGQYVSGSAAFVLDDYCQQGVPGAGGAFGYIQDVRDYSNGTFDFYLTGIKGIFQTGINILESLDGSKQVSISAIKYPDLVKYSGEILYAENISSVSRANNQSETVKLVLQYF
jgi:hypothetical protein